MSSFMINTILYCMTVLLHLKFKWYAFLFIAILDDETITLLYLQLYIYNYINLCVRCSLNVIGYVLR